MIYRFLVGAANTVTVFIMSPKKCHFPSGCGYPEDHDYGCNLSTTRLSLVMGMRTRTRSYE